MAWYLYRLGRWSFRHRFRVIGAWLALLVVGGVGALTLSGETSDQFELPDTESSQAFDLIKQRTDTTTDGAIARIVVKAPEGGTLTSEESMQAVAAALETATTDHVASVQDPFRTGAVSEDGRLAYATLTYDRQVTELTDGRTEIQDPTRLGLH